MKKLYTLIVLIFATSLLLMAEKTNPFGGGTGTIEDPFVIETAAHLDAIRGEYLSVFFKQTQDIDLNVSPYNSGSGWKPIGGNGTLERFTGHYDGNNKRISGLRIDKPGVANVGLFGHIGLDKSGETSISNLGLEDVQVIGGRGTGSMVGRVTGNQNTRIENCYVMGVEGSFVKGDGATGGLVGSNNSYLLNSAAAESFRPVINRCWANIAVQLRSETSNGKDKFGGLAGCNQKGLISNSYSMGDVTAEGGFRVGGLTGCILYRGVVSNSYSTGSVNAGDAVTGIGGLLGNEGTGQHEGTVANCYWDINTSGMPTSAGGNGLITVEMQNQANFSGWDFTTDWEIDPSSNDGYPVLRSLYNPATIWVWKTNGPSNLWDNASNWINGSVPPGNAVVRIPAGGNQPVVNAAQKVYKLILQGGANLNISNGATVTVGGNLEVEEPGIPEVSGEGKLVVAGSTLQGIPAMKIENIIIDNISNVKLTEDIRLEGQLEMVNGMLDLNGYVLRMGANAVLTEKEDIKSSSRIFGLEGYIEMVRILNQPAGNIGGLGLEIYSSANLGETTIIRGHKELNGGDESKSIFRYFDIKPTNNSGLDATLVFHYFVSELNLQEGDEENNFALFKRESDIAEWVWVSSDVDAVNHHITAHNLNGFSTWTAGSTTNPLPIALLSFDARVTQNTVLVEWVTATELNNDFFTIERSADGLHYEEITTVGGAGTSNRQHYYSFEDNDPLGGVSYYRLKQTDYDGQYEYFRPESVYMNALTADDIQVFPNPNNGSFNISTLGETHAEYRIFDMQGRQVYSSWLNPVSLNRVEVNGLQKGFYTIVIYAEETIAKKMQVY